MKKSCQYCGNEFHVNEADGRNRRKRFCSIKCRDQNRCVNLGVQRICKQCNAEFIVSKFTPHHAFCSPKCQEAARRTNPHYLEYTKNYQKKWKAALTPERRIEQRNYNTEYQRQWRDKNRDKVRAKSLATYYRHREKNIQRVKRSNALKKYQLTLEEIAARIEEQGGKCAICQRAGKRLVVDHNHDTGKVRKMLCDHCNTVVGNFENHPHLIERWQQYIASDGEIAFS